VNTYKVGTINNLCIIDREIRCAHRVQVVFEENGDIKNWRFFPKKRKTSRI